MMWRATFATERPKFFSTTNRINETMRQCDIFVCPHAEQRSLSTLKTHSDGLFPHWLPTYNDESTRNQVHGNNRTKMSVICVCACELVCLLRRVRARIARYLRQLLLLPSSIFRTFTTRSPYGVWIAAAPFDWITRHPSACTSRKDETKGEKKRALRVCTHLLRIFALHISWEHKEHKKLTKYPYNRISTGGWWLVTGTIKIISLKKMESIHLYWEHTCIDRDRCAVSKSSRFCACRGCVCVRVEILPRSESVCGKSCRQSKIIRRINR